MLFNSNFTFLLPILNNTPSVNLHTELQQKDKSKFSSKIVTLIKIEDNFIVLKDIHE